LDQWLSQYGLSYTSELRADGQRIVLNLSNDVALDLKRFRHKLRQHFPNVHVMSIGQSVEIYKGIGSVANLEAKFGLGAFAGSHGIAHTRMATESVVDLDHCHPFTAGYDLSIVHNGQISNYYRLRFQLERVGITFETDNDSEAIAHYIHYQLLQGKSLEAALEKFLTDVDGTYTFLVATPEKIGLVRDRFAAKPAVIYESEDCVAIASEYRALMALRHFKADTTIREPDAGEINVWRVAAQPREPQLSVSRS
jgi:amidophosphoribosyltransferase